MDSKGAKLRMLVGRASESPLFWPLAGRRLTSRKLAKEVGGSIFVEDGDLWWVLYGNVEIPGASDLVGFCSLRIGNKRAEFRTDFVEEAHRNKGNYTQLFAARFDYAQRHFPDLVLQVVTRHPAVARLTEIYSMEPVSQRGSFTVYRR